MTEPGFAERFDRRVRRLPHLGLGVSTEYGAHRSSDTLDLARLVAEHPECVRFLECGVEIAKGLDDDMRRWAEAGRPTTYHFLDLNLDEPEDFDPAWMTDLRGFLEELKPAWICGDAGLWHFGPRDRGHMLLLPPILTDASATALAEGIVRLREATGREVLPENPPGQVFLGDLHILDFFARVAERADTGILLDLAHLAIYQRAMGFEVSDGLDGFPLERVVEVHVAGGRERTHEGLAWIDDEHGPEPVADTWALAERVIPSAPELRAVVFECERNPNGAVGASFGRLAALMPVMP